MISRAILLLWNPFALILNYSIFHSSRCKYCIIMKDINKIFRMIRFWEEGNCTSLAHLLPYLFWSVVQHVVHTIVPLIIFSVPSLFFCFIHCLIYIPIYYIYIYVHVCVIYIYKQTLELWNRRVERTKDIFLIRWEMGVDLVSRWSTRA